MLTSYSSSFSSSAAFSLSEKFKSDRSVSVSTNSVSFEARAMCSEYEAKFKPYAEHELDPEFLKALKSLPHPYDKDNQKDVSMYDKFITTYGTHYIRKLVLGGKRIYSNSMTSQDYASLISDSVDVSSTMDFEVSAAMGASMAVKASHVKAAAKAATLLGGPTTAAIGNVAVEVMGDTIADDEVFFGADYNQASSFSMSNFASNSRQAEALQKMSSKKVTSSEVNVGGSPDTDWRNWAGTVKDRPMPINYELAPLLEFMTFEQATAFIDAVEDIYGVSLSEKPPDRVPSNMHFGVFGGSGEPGKLTIWGGRLSHIIFNRINLLTHFFILVVCFFSP